MTLATTIVPLLDADFAEFIDYLGDHTSDNGTAPAGYFMPMPRAESKVDPERAAAFRRALGVAIGEPGWRRAWVARDAEGRIAGHADLRARPERHTAHRCVLGMGVDRRARGQGLGGRLLEHVRAWALAETGVEWIDLQVMSGNAAARRLYERAGFQPCGEIADLFRVDGIALGECSMSLRLARERA